MERRIGENEPTWVGTINRSRSEQHRRFPSAIEQFSEQFRAESHRREKEISHQHYADYRVLEVIVRSPGILLDQIVFECSDLTWNQVFRVIDRFSREGVLTMSPKGLGQYAITFSPTPTPPSSRQCVNECK